MTLDTKLAATLHGKVLRFFSFHIVRQIFDLSEYYIEATDADLEAFASMETVLAVDKAHFKEVADTWIRRKVSLITQSQILQKVPLDDIKKAAAMFGISLSTSFVNGVEVIALPPDKSEIKKVMRFLDEDYYQSILLRQNYISNSRRLA